MLYEFLQSLLVIILCWFLSVFVFAPAIARTFLSRERLKWLAKLNSDGVATVIAETVKPYVETEFKSLYTYGQGTSESKSHLRILEIGVGTGVNFSYYPQGCHVICVDHNPHYSDRLNESLSNNSHVTLERELTTSAEDMHDVPDGIVDCVVSTYTLCAADNTDAVLQEVKRVLKPGGCMLFVEPVGDSENSWIGLLQKIISPLFFLLLGYHINRPLAESLTSSNFSKLEYSHIYPEGFNLCIKPHITGIAIK